MWHVLSPFTGLPWLQCCLPRLAKISSTMLTEDCPIMLKQLPSSTIIIVITKIMVQLHNAAMNPHNTDNTGECVAIVIVGTSRGAQLGRIYSIFTFTVSRPA